MAMNGIQLAAERRAAMDAVVSPQSSDPQDTIDYSTALLEADSLAIVAHIVNNAVVTTTSGAPDSEHIGEID